MKDNATASIHGFDTSVKDKGFGAKINGYASLCDDISQEVKQTTEFVDPLLTNVFIPKWDNKPVEVPAILTLGGTSILTYQNTSSIIASPGVGKSSICESIAASVLNPNADTLGFSVSGRCRGILYIDNERTNTDVWNSFHRMCKRAGVHAGSDLSKVQIAGLRSIARAADRRRVIEQLLQDSQYDLLLIDGAGDLVEDVNDQPQAIECRIWFRELTVDHTISILTTLHPNPNSTKPRGHLGSEVTRESECVLIAKKVDENLRVITSDFEHGKNRNNAPITTAYRWCDESSMFITTDSEVISVTRPAKSSGARVKAENLFLKVLPAPKAMTSEDLIKEIMEITECSRSTAKRRKDEMVDFGFIKKYEDDFFRAA